MYVGHECRSRIGCREVNACMTYVTVNFSYCVVCIVLHQRAVRGRTVRQGAGQVRAGLAQDHDQPGYAQLGSERHLQCRTDRLYVPC